MKNLLQSLSNLMIEDKSDNDFSAICYKIKRAGNLRYCYLKINSGTLKTKDLVETPYGQQKVDEIKFPYGCKFVTTNTVTAGEVCVVTGLDSVSAGDVLGINFKKIDLKSIPVFSASVIYDNKYSSREIYEKMKIIEDEENTLSARYNEQLDEITINFMGKITLQIIEYEFMRRFGITISFDNPGIIYKETIANSVIGYGHFEPLRHYAEVHIKINPLPRGRGITFKSECSTDILKKDVQNTFWQLFHSLQIANAKIVQLYQ